MVRKFLSLGTNIADDSRYTGFKPCTTCSIGSNMEKESTLYFQTSLEIKSALETIAEKEHQNVSSIMESIVCKYLQSNQGVQVLSQNQRRSDRKKVKLTALIGKPQSRRQDFVKGDILDISLGGIRFSVPKEREMEILADNKTTECHVMFTIPDTPWQTKVNCRFRRVLKSGDAVQVGAAFVNADFLTYAQLQKYLTLEETSRQ